MSLEDLCTAARWGNMAAVRRILDRADNDVDLNEAPKHGHTPLYSAASRGEVYMVRYLLELGARPDCSNSSADFYPGATAFHAVCMEGDDRNPITDSARINIFKMLLAHGGNVNIKDYYGRTPLHNLICSCNSGVEPMRWLLDKAGADVSLQDNYGSTAFHVGAVLYLSHKEEVFRTMLQQGGDAVNFQTSEGETALHILIYKIRPDLVPIFLENGADVSIEFNGETAIQLAMNRFGTVPRRGHDKSMDEKKLVEITESLVQHGADLNSKWKDDGRTLLQRAAHDGLYQAVKVLLKNRAPADQEDPSGKLPFELACEGGHLDCIFLLFQHGFGDNLITFRKEKGHAGKRPASAMYE